jgi:hypothetical protein
MKDRRIGMSLSMLRAKVLEEVNLFPESKLPDLYDFIHYFRLGLETSRGNGGQIMQFAGTWKDMPDEIFAAFLKEVVERRQRAFSRRRTGETDTD